jgi:AcrR family transcriptional regulator
MATLMMEPIVRATQHDGDFETTIHAFVSERVTFAVAHPAAIPIELREGLLRPQLRVAIMTFFNQLMRLSLEALIENARVNGQNHDLPTEVVVRVIAGQVAAYLAERVLLAPDKPWDDAVEVDRIIDLIMHGIAGTSR